MSVTIEKNGPVTTVILHRPEVRNAVDRDTAEALVAAFGAFAADDESSVAVLYGDGGTFCAGADVKAIAAWRGHRTEATGDGPTGPSRELKAKPVIATMAGYTVWGGLESALGGALRVIEEG